jgi:hypothetical protein
LACSSSLQAPRPCYSPGTDIFSLGCILAAMEASLKTGQLREASLKTGQVREASRMEDFIKSTVSRTREEDQFRR